MSVRSEVMPARPSAPAIDSRANFSKASTSSCCGTRDSAKAAALSALPLGGGSTAASGSYTRPRVRALGDFVGEAFASAARFDAFVSARAAAFAAAWSFASLRAAVPSTKDVPLTLIPWRSRTESESSG
jgi:hypothetical protein